MTLHNAEWWTVLFCQSQTQKCPYTKYKKNKNSRVTSQFHLLIILCVRPTIINRPPQIRVHTIVRPPKWLAGGCAISRRRGHVPQRIWWWPTTPAATPRARRRPMWINADDRGGAGVGGNYAERCWCGWVIYFIYLYLHEYFLLIILFSFNDKSNYRSEPSFNSYKIYFYIKPTYDLCEQNFEDNTFPFWMRTGNEIYT